MHTMTIGKLTQPSFSMTLRHIMTTRELT